MKDSYSIQEIGEAINKAIKSEPSIDKLVLSQRASILAECYGMMIYLHEDRILVSDLSAEQLRVLDEMSNQANVGGEQ